MSIRFAIRNTASPATKEGDLIVRFSGVSEPFRRHSERDAKKVGIDAKGNPKIVYETGLDEKKVQFYSWYSEEERKILTKHLKEMKPIITDFYGGIDVLEPSNSFFWREDRNINRLSLSYSDIDTFYDTTNPAHALLYLSIAAGAFIELVAPTREWADRHQTPHYMILETEAAFDDDDTDVTKSEAHAALTDIRKNEGKDALYILAWCLQYDTNAFGAYSNSVSERDLVNYHIKYIEGKLVTKKKKNMPKLFLEYVEKWKGQQTRPLLYAEAYVKAGEYYSFINQREKKYVTSDGTILGNTVKEAVDNLFTKPKFNQDFQKLREQVEAKWKE